MAAHTEGPWITINDHPSDKGIWYVRSEPDFDVEVAVCWAYGVGDAQCEANARLIATAPDLLAIVREALPIFESMDHAIEEGDESMPLIAACRAAIAKAEGAATPEEVKG